MRIVGILAVAVIVLISCASGVTEARVNLGDQGVFKGEKVIKTDAEWKEILTPEEYYILRQGERYICMCWLRTTPF